MKEKKIFSSIEGIDSKFVDEALETMKKNVYSEDDEDFVSPVKVEEQEIKRSLKPWFIKGISLAGGLCAVLAAVVAINSFGNKAEVIPAQTGTVDNTAVSDSEAVTDSEFADTEISEETSEEIKDIIIDTPVSGLPDVTSPVYAAPEECFTFEKMSMPEFHLGLFGNYLMTDDKIYIEENAVNGREVALTCYDIATGESETLFKETSDDILVKNFYPICEYNGFLYLLFSELKNGVYDGSWHDLIRIDLSDKTIETLIKDIYYDHWKPNILHIGNMLYIGKMKEEDKKFSYIDTYNMDTGETSLFKDQTMVPKTYIDNIVSYKDGIVCFTSDGVYMCNAVTGENEKKICGIDESADDFNMYDDAIFSDGETLFRFVLERTEEDDHVFFGKDYCIFEEFDGEEFKPKAIFVSMIYLNFIRISNGLVAFTVTTAAEPHRPVGVIYDKNSGEFYKVDIEGKSLEFYASDNRLFYSVRSYDAETGVTSTTGEQYFEVKRK